MLASEGVIVKELATKLDHYRIRARLTQTEIAKRTGRVKNGIGKIMNGDRLPSAKALDEICQILRVTEEEKQELISLVKDELYTRWLNDREKVA